MIASYQLELFNPRRASTALLPSARPPPPAEEVLPRADALARRIAADLGARVRLVVDDMPVVEPNDVPNDARADWLKQSQRALAAVWDNAQDDVFNDLLAP